MADRDPKFSQIFTFGSYAASIIRRGHSACQEIERARHTGLLIEHSRPARIDRTALIL